MVVKRVVTRIRERKMMVMAREWSGNHPEKRRPMAMAGTIRAPITFSAGKVKTPVTEPIRSSIIRPVMMKMMD